MSISKSRLKHIIKEEINSVLNNMSVIEEGWRENKCKRGYGDDWDSLDQHEKTACIDDPKGHFDPGPEESPGIDPQPQARDGAIKLTRHLRTEKTPSGKIRVRPHIDDPGFDDRVGKLDKTKRKRKIIRPSMDDPEFWTTFSQPWFDSFLKMASRVPRKALQDSAAALQRSLKKKKTKPTKKMTRADLRSAGEYYPTDTTPEGWKKWEKARPGESPEERKRRIADASIAHLRKKREERKRQKSTISPQKPVSVSKKSISTPKKGDPKPTLMRGYAKIIKAGPGHPKYNKALEQRTARRAWVKRNPGYFRKRKKKIKPVIKPVVKVNPDIERIQKKYFADDPGGIGKAKAKRYLELARQERERRAKKTVPPVPEVPKLKLPEPGTKLPSPSALEESISDNSQFNLNDLRLLMYETIKETEKESPELIDPEGGEVFHIDDDGNIIYHGEESD